MAYDADALPNGSRLSGERFATIEYVSRGKYGLTYRATDSERPGQVVLIKEYFPEYVAKREGTRVRFPYVETAPLHVKLVVLEAMQQDIVRHPSVAGTIFTFRDNGTAYTAMELIAGETLKQLRAKGPIDRKVLLKVFLTVFDAILHFSKAGLAHGDLNWGNIMLRENGDPVIIDFGLARPRGSNRSVLSPTPKSASPSRDADDDASADVTALCASMTASVLGSPIASGEPRGLQALKAAGKHEALDGYDDRFLACLDRGLGNGRGRLRNGAQVLSLLGLNASDLGRILPEAVLGTTLLNADDDDLRGYRATGRAGRLADDQKAGTRARHQRAILQSFDTARFQDQSVKYGNVASSEKDKVALARSEALLNVLFGREIVVPAGQVAESVAFGDIFMEVTQAYLPRQAQIDVACRRAGLPTFRPFRLALETVSMGDYAGFVEAYRFTGAPVLLLKNSNYSGKPQEQAAAEIDYFKKLFLDRDYAGLERAMGAKRPGFGTLAERVRGYFTNKTCIFARKDMPDVADNDYALVFHRRLADEGLAGKGLSDARASLDLVGEIAADLRQADVGGYRGNWYLYAERFAHVWPLARAYLDVRLFVTLSRQYGIDHPILISQEFEYGDFDHSLILGPKFAQNLLQADTSQLVQLSTSLDSGLDWEPVFALFEDPQFLASLRRMNEVYFSLTPERDAEYLKATNEHGSLLRDKLQSAISFKLADGQLIVEGGRAGAAMAFQAYDAVGGAPDAKRRDRDAAPSCLGHLGHVHHDHAAVRIMPSVAHNTDQTVSKDILHYYVKPYRLSAREDM